MEVGVGRELSQGEVTADVTGTVLQPLPHRDERGDVLLPDGRPSCYPQHNRSASQSPSTRWNTFLCLKI